VVSLGVFVGPPTFGYIVDKTGSYSYAWLFFSAAMGAAALLLHLVREPGEEGGGGKWSRSPHVEPRKILPETIT
jgi:MFS family permease